MMTRSSLPPLLRAAAAYHRSASTTLLHHHPHHHFITLIQPIPLLHSHPTSLSHLHFFSTSRRVPTRAPKPDIAARARQMQTRRLWTYALTFSCIAGFIVIVLNQFQDQLVFYITPEDAINKYASDPSKKKFRLGGLVLEGSVNQPASSSEMEFVITDLRKDILVRYNGSLPDLFREGHSVVVEGFVKPFTEEIRECKEAKVAEEEQKAAGAVTG
ncbi:putative heme-transporting ATPase [Heracleum sosnowskyi]|uniref:Heme-transporting ATPase n=1 Tax=Heracleum sosnowskyi TaxID=360622 RepID=A0AAD8MX02_9APIA|nr:putative heme-transporting ATPase [Heracleum sosnowskyi]